MEIEGLCFQDPWPLRSFQDELERDVAQLDVLRLAGEPSPVGVINFWLVHDEIHLLNVAVHPDHQREGLARILMAHMLRDARERGYLQVSLEVRPTNTSAIGLYLSDGFQELGRRPRYYPDGEDAIIMAKEL